MTDIRVPVEPAEDGLRAEPVPRPARRPARPGLEQQRRELRELRAVAHEGPGARATQAQRDRGKLTVRERLERLFDPGTFCEIGPFRRHQASGFGLDENRPYTDGVVTGWGQVFGETVYVYAHDFRIFGGALGQAHAEKIHRVMDLAIAARRPLVSLNDGAGARIQEGVSALSGYGGIFRRHVQASGVIPQISVLLGPCAGGAAYSPALTDFVFMVRGTSHMFITGPDVVRAVTGENVDADDLGGADMHGSISGAAHFVSDDEDSCLADVRYLLSLLPASSADLPATYTYDDSDDRPVEGLMRIVPADHALGYDVHDVIEQIVDNGDHLPVHEHWGRSIACVLARIGGAVVGIVASQPNVRAGVIDVDASQKAARFVQFCNAFRLPIVTLIDVPGFMPGRDQERGGIIRHGAKLLYAYCAATVPRVSVVLRKAYGGAYIVLDSRSVGADLAYAWAGNEIAVMGAEGAANVIFRRQIRAADDPDATRARLMQEYEEGLMHPYYAAEWGLVDDVIDPADTRRVLVQALSSLRRKDGPVRPGPANPPL
jgi:acetyl-CoA carboxylase carboxyltransferase component